MADTECAALVCENTQSDNDGRFTPSTDAAAAADVLRANSQLLDPVHYTASNNANLTKCNTTKIAR